MQGKRYNSIDLFKLLMAFCVVANHTYRMAGCENEVLCRVYSVFVLLVVPFFFISTGFLLANHLNKPLFSDEKIAVVKHSLKKSVKLYIMWSAIYLPLAVYGFYLNGETWYKSIAIYIRNFLFVGEQYNSWPLWYLLSMIYALSAVLLLMKHNASTRAAVAVGIFAFFLGSAIDWFLAFEGKLPALLELVKKLLWFSFGKGRIFEGVFYIIFGMVFSKIRQPQYAAVVYFLLMVASFIGQCYYPRGRILLVLCALSMFAWVKEIKLPDSSVYPIIRKMSTLIYFSHMYIWTFYYSIIYGEMLYSIDCFLVTTAVCIAGSAFYLLAQKKMQQVKKA